MLMTMRTKRTLLTIINDRPYFERHRQHIAEAAAQAGYRSLVAMPEVNRAKANSLIDWRCVDFRPGRIAPMQDAKVLVQLVQLLATEEPDVVHAITLKAISLAGLALRLHQARTGRRIPLVATFPGLGYTFIKQASPTIRDRIRRLVANIACWSVAECLDLWATFETEHDRALVVSAFGVPRERTTVIQGTGLDLNAFTADDKVFEEPLSLLLAGRLLRSKGVSAFVEAASLSGASRFRWRIAGWRYESPDALSETEIEDLRRAPNIEFMGAVSDMPALLRETHAVVMPSTYPEGIPRILIEAAATSTPMIVTDFPGARELVQDEATGFILEDTSGQAILAAAERLANLHDHGRAMGVRARALVHTRGFDAGSVQKSFLAVYEAALRGDPIARPRVSVDELGPSPPA